MNCKVLKCPDVFINLSFDEMGANEVVLLVASVTLRVEDENWETSKAVFLNLCEKASR